MNDLYVKTGKNVVEDATNITLLMVQFVDPNYELTLNIPPDAVMKINEYGLSYVGRLANGYLREYLKHKGVNLDDVKTTYEFVVDLGSDFFFL